MFESIIFFILLIVGLYFAFKVIKSIVKVLMIGLLIVLVIGGLVGFMFYRDAKDLRENFSTEPKLLLFESDGNLMSGAVITEDIDNLTVVSDTQLGKLQEDYAAENYRALRGDYTRVIVFKEEFFIDGLPETVEIEEFVPNTFDKDEMIELLTSDSEGEYKAFVFLSAVGHTLESRTSAFLFSQFKKGNIIIHPNTIVFAIAKRAPSWLVVPVLWILSL